jgi:hypothetical protein
MVWLGHMDGCHSVTDNKALKCHHMCILRCIAIFYIVIIVIMHVNTQVDKNICMQTILQVIMKNFKSYCIIPNFQ